MVKEKHNFINFHNLARKVLLTLAKEYNSGSLLMGNKK